MSGAAIPYICGAGAFCAIGRGVAQVDASVRAGLSRFRESSIVDRYFEPMRLSLIPEEELPPLAPSLEPLGFSARQRRLLRLAAPALNEALSALPVGEPPPLFIGLPESRPNRIPVATQEFLQALATQAEVSLDLASSQLFPLGRASALFALAAARDHLAQRRSNYALVGGLDTFLDLALLAELDAEARILGDRVMDGFIPGEGAAFVLLASHKPSDAGTAPVAVLGVGAAQDPGHRYSDQPALGEGLSAAIDKLLDTSRWTGEIAEIYAGLNGENYQAKEWGVARLRHASLFALNAEIQHPADCYGDCGAATGALLLALSATALIQGRQGSPALVWASSDRAERACALIGTLPS